MQRYLYLSRPVLMLYCWHYTIPFSYLGTTPTIFYWTLSHYLYKLLHHVNRLPTEIFFTTHSTSLLLDIATSILQLFNIMVVTFLRTGISFNLQNTNFSVTSFIIWSPNGSVCFTVIPNLLRWFIKSSVAVVSFTRMLSMYELVAYFTTSGSF